MKPLFTIGYEATTIDLVVSALKSAGVRRLADVRAVPLSRKKGFSKKALAARLAEEEIEYLHLVELGNPEPGRDAARAKQWQLFTAIYTTHLDTDSAQESLKYLSSAADQEPTCLLCFERDPATCHRSIIAERLAGAGVFEIVNLFGTEPLSDAVHSETLPCDRASEGASPPQHETR